MLVFNEQLLVLVIYHTQVSQLKVENLPKAKVAIFTLLSFPSAPNIDLIQANDYLLNYTELTLFPIVRMTFPRVSFCCLWKTIMALESIHEMGR